MKTKIAVLFFSFLAIFCFSSKVLAENWIVSTSDQLNNALTNCVSGDTITVTSDIIMASSMPAVTNKAIAIRGVGCVLNGRNNGGLNLERSTVSISGVSFEGFNYEYGGSHAIWNRQSVTTIGDRVIFSSNTASLAGGAINNALDARMTIGEGVIFLSNSSSLGGAIYNTDNSTMTIGKGVVFSSNTGSSGGAIYNHDNSTVIIGDNALFSSNTVSVLIGGGAIYSDDNSYMTIGNNAVFSSNTAQRGGAIHHSSYSVIKIGDRAIFLSNTAFGSYSGDGGAIYNTDNSTMTIGEGSIFSSNTARRYGGAVYNTDNSIMTIEEGALFSNNTSGNVGGAVYNLRNSTTTIGNNVVFSSNTSKNGGAIYNALSLMQIGKGVRFTSNTAYGNGGAISANNSTTTIADNAEFSSNTSNEYGGAIYSYNNSSMTIGNNAVFSSNTAKIGGAIYNSDASTITIGDGASFLQNTSGYSGGAIYNINNSTMTIGKGVVFSSNTASSSGGAIDNGGYVRIGDNAVFVSNEAVDNSGGAIFNGDEDILILGSGAIFSSNTASSGGAIFNRMSGAAEIGANAVFSSNVSRNSGGAVYNTNEAMMTIGDNAKLSYNTATSSGGAVYSYSSFMTIGDGGSFLSNTGGYDGGAIYNSDASTITIGDGASFLQNTSGYRGGAIFNISKTVLTIGDGAVFSSNTAGVSGGAIVSQDNSAIVEIGSNAVFSSNRAAVSGGAIYNYHNSTITIGSGALFLSNTAERGSGGAINNYGHPYNYATANITIEDGAVFSSNTARVGGAIANDGSAVMEIGKDVSFVSNTAVYYGGAIYNDNYSHMRIVDGARFLSNTGDYAGGAIYNIANSTVTIGNNAVFSLNMGSGNGGAIHNYSKSAMTIGAGTMFSSNIADGNGGAIYNYSNSTMKVGGGASFLSNEVSGSGGAIYNGAKSSITIGAEAVFSGNVAAVEGGAMCLEGGIVNMINPVFTDNEANVGGAVFMQGSSSAKSELNISVSKDIEASGNTDGNGDNVFYLAQDADLNLDIASGATMTLKDGVVSKDSDTVITKIGDGLLALESANNRIDGILNIFGGEVQAAKSIGSGNIYFDNSALLHITGDMELENEIYAKSGGVQDITIEADEDIVLTMKGITGAGSETFIKTGKGEMIFDSASSANLAKTNLTAGTLRILTEDYVSSNVEIADVAVLGGTGKITGDVINNGTIRPGSEASIGRLTIDGNYSENGILGIRLYQDEVPTNDLLSVTGSADINTASKIDLDLRSGFQIGDTRYTVLATSSGVSGIYGGFTLDFSSLDIKISSDTNNVYLEVKGVSSNYSNLTGLSHNQSEVAKEIDKVTSGTDTDAQNSFSKIIGTLEMLDNDGKKAIFDEVAGNIYANMLYASADNSGRRQVYNQIQEKINHNLDREDRTPCTYNLWAQVYGSQIKRDTDENSVNKFKDNSVYAMIGWDNYCAKENMILGYMAEFGKHSGKQASDEFSMNDYKAGIYFGTFGDRWNFKSSLNIGYQQYEVERVQKLLQTQTEAEYDGYSLSAAADLYYIAYQTEEGNFSLSPFGGLEGSFVHTDAFSETAKGNAASWLDVKANNFMTADVKLGLRVENLEKSSKLSWYAELSGKCNLTGDTGEFKAKINGFDDEIEIYGLENGKVSGKLEGGLDVKLGKHFDVFVIGVVEQAKNFGKCSGHLGVNYSW